MAEIAGYRLAEEQADDRHRRLEQAEGEAHPEPCPGVDAAEPDSDRPGEIAEADRHAHQQKTQQTGHAGNYMDVIACGWKVVAVLSPKVMTRTGQRL